MGNNCVGSRTSKDGLFPSLHPGSYYFWWSQRTGREENSAAPSLVKAKALDSVQQKPPEMVKFSNKEIKSVQPKKEQTSTPQHEKLKMQHNIKRASKLSAGLKAESILQEKTGHLKEHYNLGPELGKGQYGKTFLCIEKSSGKHYACKSIPKVKLITEDDVEDVRREIEIMHHLEGCPNVVSIKGAYEDSVAVYVVMELCEGGELFERIVEKCYYREREAAELARIIVSVVEGCHSLGVMHRDLKPENFLFADGSEDSRLLAIDFGLSVFFKPGEIFSDVVGTPYYIAPEVLCEHYGPEADVWSAGVIIYILLCGTPPFLGDSEEEIFEEVLHGDLDFSSDPWPNISESAKDLVRKMLVRDPTKRITAHEVLRHPWIQVNRVALDKPLDSAELSGLKQFSAMNKLKKMALRADADNKIETEDHLVAAFSYFDKNRNGSIHHSR